MSDPPILQENPQSSVKTTRFLVLNLPLWWPRLGLPWIYRTLSKYIIGYTTKVHQRQKGGQFVISPLCSSFTSKVWGGQRTTSELGETICLFTNRTGEWKKMLVKIHEKILAAQWISIFLVGYDHMKTPNWIGWNRVIPPWNHQFFMVQYPHCSWLSFIKPGYEPPYEPPWSSIFDGQILQIFPEIPRFQEPRRDEGTALRRLWPGGRLPVLLGRQSGSSNLEASWTLQKPKIGSLSGKPWSTLCFWKQTWDFKEQEWDLKPTKHVDFDAISSLAGWDLVPRNGSTETGNWTHEHSGLQPSVPSLLGKMWWTHLARMLFQQRWSCNWFSARFYTHMT